MAGPPSGRSAAPASGSGTRSSAAAAAASPNPDDKGRPPCPLERCSWWSALSFTWLNPIIKLGSKQVLQESDLPALAPVDRADRLEDLVLTHWASEVQARPEAPRLWRALLRAFVPLNLSSYPLYFLASMARILQAAVGMNGLVRALEEPQRDGAIRDAYLYAGVIVVMGLANFLLLHQVQFMGWRLGLWMRTATEAAILRKVLRMPLAAFAESGEEAVPRGKEHAAAAAATHEEHEEEDEDTEEEGSDSDEEGDAYHQSITPGLIMNMATTGVDRFQRIGSLIHYLVFAPLDILIVSFFGVHNEGWSFLIGVAVLFLLIPAQALMAHALQRAGKRASVLTDKRVRLTTQMVQGARTIKMGGWEHEIERRISEARAAEMTMLRRAGALRGLNDGVYFVTPVLVGAAIFVTDWALGKDLGPGRVFTTLTLFGILQWNAIYMGGRALQSLNELWVSVNRLEHLFRMPELPAHRIEEARGSPTSTRSPSPPAAPPSIRVRRLSFNYHGSTSKEMPALRQVSFNAEAGSILGVVGPVGSGKTTLLKALLGEMGHADQKAVLDVGPGPIAYASQEPWILTASVRENVLAGRPYDAGRYRAVLKASCLARDLRQFDFSDQQIIGDRGVNMSGGQKARLGLARMAYGDAALYLIDDALSALDPRVGRRVFDRLICGLLRGKTRVLATHQLQYLMDPAEVPSVLYLDRGKLRCQGTMAELLARGVFRDNTNTSCRTVSSANGTGPAAGSPTMASPVSVHQQADAGGVGEGDGEEGHDEAEEDAFLCMLVEGVGCPVAAAVAAETMTSMTMAERKTAAEAASIISREERQSGSSGAGPYAAYIEGMGGVPVALGVLLLMASAQLAAIFSNLELSAWVKLPYAQQQERTQPLATYLGLVGAVTVLAVVRALVASERMLRASQRLHDGMIHALLRTPIAFYDTNPEGRIVNRTTKDVLTLDVALPVSLYAFVQMIFICLGTVGVIVLVNPWLFLLLVPLLVIFIPLRRQFLNTSREVRRLESVASSPVYSLLSESMAGLATLRSVGGAVGMFEREFNRRLDGYSRPFFIFFSAGRHLGFRLDFLCWVMTSCTAFASLGSASPKSGVTNWLIGMSLMYVLQLAGIFQWTVRQFADVENEIVAVERVKEYNTLPPEAALDSGPGQAPPAGWPDKGAIVATGLEVAYRPGLPLVLKGLTFFIEGGQRVGIVGRTGSGKTTILQALLRLMEPSAGRLEIDGVDVARIGLHDLRRSLAIVPQDPFLFSGTLRQNLDPLGKHDDADLWSALRSVQLEEDVKIWGLDVECTTKVQLSSTPRSVTSLWKPSARGSGSVGRAVSSELFGPSSAPGLNATGLDSSGNRVRPFSAEQEHPLSVLERVGSDSSCVPRNPSSGDLRGHPHGPGLDFEVSENNFSQGERQLLCLARAILQDARILVCDEATANVDIATDAKIQRAIRERFAGATVLMIAHRLNTIIDSDQVLVLADGRLLEAGHPHALLNTPEGLPLGGGGLRDMVQQTGPETEAALRRAARAAWEARRR